MDCKGQDGHDWRRLQSPRGDDSGWNARALGVGSEVERFNKTFTVLCTEKQAVAGKDSGVGLQGSV